MKPDNKPLAAGPGHMSDPELLAAMCKALGHPARVMIIRYLKEIDRCLCGDIVKLLPLAQSTVSQHLKCLKDAGFVIGVVEGPTTCYCLDKAMLGKFSMMAGVLADQPEHKFLTAENGRFTEKPEGSTTR